MVIEKTSFAFADGAIRILTSLGCSTFGCTQEELNRMMAERGYKKGYRGHWIEPEDIIIDEEY